MKIYYVYVNGYDWLHWIVRALSLEVAIGMIRQQANTYIAQPHESLEFGGRELTTDGPAGVLLETIY